MGALVRFLSASGAALFVFSIACTARAGEPGVSYEEALMGGFATTSDYLGVGPVVEFELGGRRQLETFSSAFALRARYERYTTNAIGACYPTPVPLSGPCTSPGVSSYNFELDETLVTFELPLSLRLGSAGGTMLPYVGLAPGLVYDRRDLSSTTGRASFASEISGRASLHGFAGTQVRIGPGGLFFEWGFRVAPIEHRPEWDSHLTSFLGSLGYRLTL
jgi:hypothetical protein